MTVKQKLKWYAPLGRWLTEEEHRAHIAVEPELRDVYASIAAEAIPADLAAVESPAQPARVDAIDTIYGLAALHQNMGAAGISALYSQNQLAGQQTICSVQSGYGGGSSLNGILGGLFGLNIYK
jgi:hypothetical protein